MLALLWGDGDGDGGGRGGPRGGPCSFLVVGDWGGIPEPPFATPREVATAAAMGRAATELGADFVLALGDNFYYKGVRDEWDPRFQDTFERVFSVPGLRNLPWFVLAGNHDHAGNVTAQMAYGRHSPRWHFPHYFYSLRLSLPGTNASARLLLLDTVLLCGGGDDAGGGRPRGPRDAAAAAAQLRWLRRRLAAARGDRFVLLAGHYPLWSAGEHGPSGCLRRLLRPAAAPPPAPRPYLSGHDHNLQFLQEGGVAYVVSGAGNFVEASRRHAGALPPGALRFFFGAPAAPGAFAHVRLHPRAATVTFLESTGRVLYRVTLPPRDPLTPGAGPRAASGAGPPGARGSPHNKGFGGRSRQRPPRNRRVSPPKSPRFRPETAAPPSRFAGDWGGKGARQRSGHVTRPPAADWVEVAEPSPNGCEGGRKGRGVGPFRCGSRRRPAMGRRKSKRKPPPKKKVTGTLETQFTCPFCNHEKSCDVKMDRARNTGVISCTVCLEEFQTPITYLSEPVDVYSDWIDACEAANQ
ncbi:LOW QUALITY PROTEIN: tartrate-resistant acid phosphatase type 5-like [Columba livia]